MRHDLRRWMTLCEGLLDEAKRVPPPLPKRVGEVPFWRTPLREMSQRLELNEWQQGGCFAFAEALAKVYHGGLWGFCTFHPDDDPLENSPTDYKGDYPVEHAVAKIGASFYDFTGMLDVKHILRQHPTYRLKSRDDDFVFWFEDEFLDDRDWAKLLAVLGGRKS